MRSIDAHPPHEVEGQIEVFPPSKVQLVVLLITLIMLCLVAVVSLVVEDYYDPETELYAGAMFLGSGLFRLKFFVFLIRGAPKIVLSPEGIRHLTGFKTIFWKWADVGPFAADVQKGGAGAFAVKIYFACAYSNHRHDLMAKRGQAEAPNLENADLKFKLQMMLIGRNLETAQDFIDPLNNWRDCYGRPASRSTNTPPTRPIAPS